MKLLLTGGAGYVGSACLRNLVRRGHKVVAFDNLRKGHVEAVAGHPLVKGDIADTKLLEKTLSEYEVDAVMHFAAATDVGESVVQPDYHYGNNVGGTLSLLKAMRATGVKRLLFSSTCATYGLSQHDTMAEDTPQEPFSPYARSKLTVEWMIRDFAEAYGLGFTLLRYFNAAGADEDGQFGEAHDPEFHLIPVVLQYCLGQRDKLSVYGNDYATLDGTCIRDYVHTNDLALAHYLAIEATSVETREVYNIGTGTGSSVLEIFEACSRVTGRKIPYELADRRPGDPASLVANGSKIRGALGWSPAYTSIEDTIETAWRWHSLHPDGYVTD